ncbi:MAG TPA: DUF6152 family protein [Micropepsaceae bacterium]|nr:DUF6152 family protein [Micropepsaceae bacterium]
MKIGVPAIAVLALSAVSGSALAHHSFAMFDPDKLIIQTGIVKEFEWTNPHVWIHIMAPDASGKQVEWSFEMQAVAQATTGGWRSDSVRPGDKVSIEFHPLKDGSRGGELVAATLPDGKRLGAQAARLPVPKAP